MIELTNVTKKYGKIVAISHISLNLPKEGIYSLLGRNGAGKTTLMKMLAGHIQATEGQITISGHNISPSHTPENVNFIESNSVQYNMKASMLLDTAAKLQDDFDRDFAYEMMKRFKLDPNKKYKNLSFGMKTMLTSIMTLANNSEVILLDEPTLGFDAIMRDQFNTLLLESYHTHPRIIIISTHLIDEISKVTERLIIIDKGMLLLETGIDDIDEKAYTLSGPVKLVQPLLERLNCIGKTIAGNVMAANIYDDRITLPEGVEISRLQLQDFFINIVGGNKNEQ